MPVVTKAKLREDFEAVVADRNKSIEDRDRKIEEMTLKLKAAETQARLAKQDSDRHEKNWNDCEARLTAIRTVIATALEVSHGVGVMATQEWFRGQMVPDESDKNEAVRLLRHIHKLSNTQPPF